MFKDAVFAPTYLRDFFVLSLQQVLIPAIIIGNLHVACLGSSASILPVYTIEWDLRLSVGYARNRGSARANTLGLRKTVCFRSIISLGHVVISSLTEILVQCINLGVGYMFRFLPGFRALESLFLQGHKTSAPNDFNK
ncbi:hypothetical protein CGGC5_v009570 [Colletotrichum fructicola Nara gc5]|uniref:Uncharacterized protein n=1 Tax=Colletotrichum fructicola (strain Nara gc5) TaxID=1213859 RepID=A0A7J6J2Y9_COLFN|nr:hypothetical protein CGGC5_v009570 [Colletotrichum fructicola Nara gc5]